MVEYHRTPLSFSLLGTAVAAQLMAGTSAKIPWPRESHPYVKISGSESTQGARWYAQRIGVDAFAGFYSDFLSQQESLGSEFERILVDNLWNLYER